MKDRMKYILIGIITGIVIGMALFYLLITLRVVQPFRPFGLDNFSGNFSRRFNRSEMP